MTAFCETLYHRNRDALHLVIDEADAFAPQKPFGDQARLLGAVEDLVRRGRAKGIGLTLISQRAAVLNKNVLTQVAVLVVLRTVSPQDHKAIDDWIKVHGTEKQRAELMKSLASLPIGTAWFWSPGWLNIFQKVKVRRIETFDSSATPKVGEKLSLPKKIAEIDLDKIRGTLAETIEKSKQEDPKFLKREIERLKKEAKNVPVAKVDHEATMKAVNKAVTETVSKFEKKLNQIRIAFQKAAGLLGIDEARSEPIKLQPVITITEPKTRFKKVQEVVLPKKTSAIISSGESIPQGPRKILTALAQYESGLTKKKLALLTTFAVGSGTFSTYISSLKTKGYVVYRNDRFMITDEGLAALGDYEVLPTGGALFDLWLNQLGAGEAKILQALYDCDFEEVSKAHLAEITGFAATSGTYNTYLSKLRTLELIEGKSEIKLSDTFQ